jgi:hypothetical protein
VLGGIALLVLWSFSYPGVHFLGVIISFWLVAVVGAIWAVRTICYLFARRAGTHTGNANWFFVAPAGALILTLLLGVHAPLKLRWELAKADFERTIADLSDKPPGLWWETSRIGTYEIINVEKVKGGVIFHESAGAGFDDAGFAYLPYGPTPDLENTGFENPQWRALGDGWYAWTASW